LFLEEIVGERFAPTDPVQRACAARWLGQLHGGSTHLTGAGLPDRGPAQFLAALQSVRRAIAENWQNPVFDGEAHAVLQAVLDCTGRLESIWDRVERACAAMPRTFVHGDFAPKNIYIRGDGAGRELCVIDWEHSGLGVPAVDLANCREGHRQVNLGSYAQLTGWPRQAVAEWSVVGNVFRQLVTMDWASRSLPFQWAEKPISSLRIYLQDLERALARAGWARA
jgi:aminoglycoside phosphotransferase (APT) family kinase protein